MTLSILVFGSAILLAGALLLIYPGIIFAFLRSNIENSAIHVIAILVRFVIGILLIIQSSLSKFPIIIELLGFTLVVAAFLLAVIGRTRFRKLMTWVIFNLKPFDRMTGIIAISLCNMPDNPDLASARIV